MAKTRYDIDGFETKMGSGRASFEQDGQFNLTTVAAAIIGGAVVGGVLSSSASKSAANTQADAARDASSTSLQATRETNALQAAMYQQNLQNQSPWLKSGNVALAALTGGLGLGSVYKQPVADGRMTIPTTPSRASALGVPSNAIDTGNGNAVVPDGNGGYRVTNGRMQIQAAPTSSAGRVGIDAPQTMAGLTGTPTATGGGLIPAGTSGVQNYGASPEDMAAAAGQYAGADGKGTFTDTFTPSDLYTDPSYKWRLEQGKQALDASAAARGTTGSGQNLKDITDYAQGAASTEYGAAYDRFMNNQSTLYNRLAGLAGVGQTTAGTLGAAAQNTASAIGQNTMAGVGASNNALIGGANAQAAGTVGAANAWSNAIGSGTNNYVGWQYLQGKNGATTAAPAATSSTSLAGEL